MSYCRICGAEEDVAYRPAQRQTLCGACLETTPPKVDKATFERVYWGGEDPMNVKKSVKVKAEAAEQGTGEEQGKKKRKQRRAPKSSPVSKLRAEIRSLVFRAGIVMVEDELRAIKRQLKAE